MGDNSVRGTKREFESVNSFPSKKQFIQESEPWNPQHNTILVVTKARDNKLVTFTQQLAEWLIFTPRFNKKHPFIVYVDGHLKESKLLNYNKLVKKDSAWKTHLQFWTPKLCYSQPDLFHLIITLGGDGTILFTSTLFQTKIPPIMPFNLGSLGFLTPFLFTKYREELDKLFNGQLKSTTRMRLASTVYRYRKDPYCLLKPRASKDSGNTVWTDTIPANSNSDFSTKWELMETAWMRKAFEKAAHSGSSHIDLLDDKIMCYTTVPEKTVHVLNELVVDRGPNSNISMLELFGDERHLTTVQADGLCIATATGSTAYSLSANGSLTHPDMRCTLVTPICPHTLNFRPMMLPSQIAIRVVIPFGSRNTAYCSFDGRNRVELKHGDHVKIMESPYPVKTFCADNSSNDWFFSVQTCLQWNMRKKQKSFVVVEGDDEQSKEPETDSLFTRLKPDDDKQPNQSSLSEVDTSDTEEREDRNDVFDLIPWTEQELKRDSSKNTSRI